MWKSTTIESRCESDLGEGVQMKNDNSEDFRFGVLMGFMSAAILTLGWLIISFIEWNFTVAAWSLRLLLVFSVLAGVVGYVGMKFK